MQDLRDECRREITEMKQTMEEFKSRLDEVEETVNGIEITEQEYREAKAERDKRISKNERILRELCNQSKLNNICIIGVLEEEEREKEIENVFDKIIAGNFSSQGKEIASLITRDPRRTTPRHIIIKMTKIKDKDRILQAARERKKITYKGK